MCQRGNGLIRNVNLNSTERRLKAPLQKKWMHEGMQETVARELGKAVSKERERSL